VKRSLVSASCNSVFFDGTSVQPVSSDLFTRRLRAGVTFDPSAGIGWGNSLVGPFPPTKC